MRAAGFGYPVPQLHGGGWAEERAPYRPLGVGDDHRRYGFDAIALVQFWSSLDVDLLDCHVLAGEPLRFGKCFLA